MSGRTPGSPRHPSSRHPRLSGGPFPLFQSLTPFHADFGKEFPSRTFWRDPSRNCPSPSSALCPLLYRTEHFSRGRNGEECAEKRGGRGVASKGGAKRKKGRAKTGQKYVSLRGPQMGGQIRRGWIWRFRGAPIFRPEVPKPLKNRYSGTSGRKIGAPQKRQIQPRRIWPPILGNENWTQTFFSQTFRAPPGYFGCLRDIPPKKFDFPGFEGHIELFGPHPFMWKTPAPPEKIRTKKFRFGFLFRAWHLRPSDSPSTFVVTPSCWPSEAANLVTEGESDSQSFSKREKAPAPACQT